jgi:GTP-binding protein
MRPVVAILGRPNVGKSSLFNRLIRSRKAVVDDRPGVTRDRNLSICEYDGRRFFLVDTGGFWAGAGAPDPLAEEVRRMALLAVEEADVCILLLDGKEGLSEADRELVELMRRHELPQFFAVNKIDHPSHEARSAEFYELGVEPLYAVSAAHGRGLEELMDAVVAALPPAGPEELAEGPGGGGAGRRGMAEFMAAEPALGGGLNDEGWQSPAEAVAAVEPAEDEETPREEGAADVDPTEGFVVRVAVLGRPNVGKSTLVNRLLGYERSLVSPLPGTTRDSVDAYLEHEGRGYILVDTAGVRRKSRIGDRVEAIAALKARRTIEACHLVLMVVDATQGVTEQDARLASQALHSGRAVVVVSNKMDLLRGDADLLGRLDSSLDRNLPHLSFSPVVRLSAKTGRGLPRLFRVMEEVQRHHAFSIRTGPFNRALEALLRRNPPPLHHHHRVKIYYGTQVGIRPPTFVVWANQPQALSDGYRRYLTNHLSEAWGLQGTPIRLLIRRRVKRES